VGGICENLGGAADRGHLVTAEHVAHSGGVDGGPKKPD
jgi:hypothetical protein